MVCLDDTKEMSRYLSISSSPTEKGYVEFTKKLTESPFSKKLASLKAGDTLKIKFVAGNFGFSGDEKKVSFLSGGIGITPIRSMVKYAKDTGLDVNMALFYGNHSEKDIAFRDDLENMSGGAGNFKLVNVLCEVPEGAKCRKGYVNSTVIKEETPDFAERKYFICGPPGMVAAMKKILLDELKVEQKMIITENFAGYE
jgi:ferredoxin-NADP reductase